MLKESLLAWGNEKTGIEPIPVKYQNIYLKKDSSNKIYIVSAMNKEVNNSFTISYNATRPQGNYESFYFDYTTHCLIRIAIVAEKRDETVDSSNNYYTVVFEALDPNNGNLLDYQKAEGYSYISVSELPQQLAVNTSDGIYSFYFNGKKAYSQAQNHRLACYIPQIKKIVDINLSNSQDLTIPETFPESQQASATISYHYGSGLFDILYNREQAKIGFSIYTKMLYGQKPTMYKCSWCGSNVNVISARIISSTASVISADRTVSTFCSSYQYSAPADSSIWKLVTDDPKDSTTGNNPAIWSLGCYPGTFRDYVIGTDVKATTLYISEYGNAYNWASVSTGRTEFDNILGILDKPTGTGTKYIVDRLGKWAEITIPDILYSSIGTVSQGPSVNFTGTFQGIGQFKITSGSNYTCTLITGKDTNTSNVYIAKTTDESINSSNWTTAAVINKLSNVIASWANWKVSETNPDNLVTIFSDDGYVSISTTGGSNESDWSNPMRVLPTTIEGEDTRWYRMMYDKDTDVYTAVGSTVISNSPVNINCKARVATARHPLGPWYVDSTPFLYQGRTLLLLNNEQGIAITKTSHSGENGNSYYLAIRGIKPDAQGLTYTQFIYECIPDFKSSVITVRYTYTIITNPYNDNISFFSFYGDPYRQGLYSVTRGSGTASSYDVANQQYQTTMNGKFLAVVPYNSSIKWQGYLASYSKFPYQLNLYTTDQNPSVVFMGGYTLITFDSSVTSSPLDSVYAPTFTEGPIYSFRNMASLYEHYTGTTIVYNELGSNSTPNSMSLLDEWGNLKTISGKDATTAASVDLYQSREFCRNRSSLSAPSSKNHFAFIANTSTSTDVLFASYVTLSDSYGVLPDVMPQVSNVNLKKNWAYRDDVNDGVSMSDLSVIAVGDLDESNWKPRVSDSNLTPGSTFYCIAYGNNQFVAVSTTGYVSTSPDGVNWTTATQNSTLSGITPRYMDYGNNTFMIIGNSGSVAISADGVNWTLTPAVINKPDNFAFCNNQFIALYTNGSIRTTTDGITWSDSIQSLPTRYGSIWNTISYCNGIYVAASNASYSTVGVYVATSTDLTNWEVIEGVESLNTNYMVSPVSNLAVHWLKIVSDGSRFIYFSDGGYTAISTDGKSWSYPLKNINLLNGWGPAGGGIQPWYSMAYGNNRYVAIGYNCGVSVATHI